MPIPTPHKDEKDFIGRCMSDPVMNKEYPDQKQRYAICKHQMDTKGVLGKLIDLIADAFSKTRRK